MGTLITIIIIISAPVCVYPCWGLGVALYIACMLVSIGSRSQSINTEAVTKALS